MSDDAKFIRNARKRLGLVPLEFAKLLGTTRMTIWRWENGVAPVSQAIRMLVERLLEEKRRAS